MTAAPSTSSGLALSGKWVWIWNWRRCEGGDPSQVAARLQAAISPSVEARLDELLGHPPTCPHGNPIDAEIARRRPPGTPLSTIEAGQTATIYRITEAAEEDKALLSYLEARALQPGARLLVLARSESLDSLTLDGPRGRATLVLEKGPDHSVRRVRLRRL